MAKSSISRQIGKKSVSVKTKVLDETGDLITRSQAVVLTEYRGLTVPQMSDIRKKLRDADADFSVVKNTLFKRAADGQMPVDQLDEHLAGPTAIGFAKSDPVGAAKILVDFVREHKAISLKAGVMEGQILDIAQIEALSKIPPREVLIAQMLGSLNSPIAGLVGTLNGILSNFVFTLQAIADKQGDGAEATA